MDNASYGDIIFFAAVAVYLAFKLSSVLGKKNEGDENFTGGASGYGGVQPETVPKLEIKEKVEETVEKEATKEIDQYNFASDKVKNKFQEILSRDATLTISGFVNGAKTAFDMVLKSFSEGEKTTLQTLLSAPLYKDFIKQLDEYRKKDLVPHKSLISISLDEISDAEIKDNNAKISLKFITEQINFVKDEDGKITEGDSSFIETIEDEWSFERNLKSSNPNWQIIAV